MTNEERLQRIGDLTANARNTWFILLGVLIFVGVTMLGVRPIDFYGVSRNTELPLVGVSVPTILFFYTAPILTVAVYGYFHLYLIRIWDELSLVDAQIDGRPLSDAVKPWLVTDTALYVRRLLRKDGCSTPRSLDFASAFWNAIFAWAAGPIVLILLWRQSLVARDITTSGIAAAMVVFALIFCFGSAMMVITRMRRVSKDPDEDVRYLGQLNIVMWITATLLIASYTSKSTEGPRGALATVDLTGEEIVERPDGWLPYRIAREDFLAVWCEREQEACDLSELSGPARDDFDAEWDTRRAAQRNDLRKPTWHEAKAKKPDLRDALMSSVFLVGADLGGALLNGADLSLAQMEGADLSGAQVEGADLSGAQMDGADLSRALMEKANLSRSQLEGTIAIDAQMKGADLSRAKMEHTILAGAHMEGADLSWARMDRAILNGAQMAKADLTGAEMKDTILFGAQMDGADLSRTKMDGANLNRSHMNGADLTRAQMGGADLTRAYMKGVDLTRAQIDRVNLNRAQMDGAVFDFSELTGSSETMNRLRQTNLRASTNMGGALRFVDLTGAIFDRQTDFRNAFLDGSVNMTEAFRDQMGHPCQWLSDVIEDDAAFYGRWRGWIQAAPSGVLLPWSFIAPEGFENVPPYDWSKDGCAWNTDPLP